MSYGSFGKIYNICKSASEAASYTVKYSVEHGLGSTVHASLPHFHRFLMSTLLNQTQIQLILDRQTTGKVNVARSGKLWVLFVFVPEVSSRLYRIINQMEQLELQGYRCASISLWSLDLLKYIDLYDIFIFHKLPYTQVTGKILKKLRGMKKIVIYDIDDLVFDPSLLKRLTVISSELTSAYRLMLMKCDYVLTTTDFLARMLRQMGVETFVNRNCLGLEQIRASQQAFSSKQPSCRVRIGYFSGTASHDFDFLEASEAIIHIMNEYDFVDLYIAGPLKLSDKFDFFKQRIKRLPFVHWSKLPFNIAKVDINIAPLEMKNIFSEGKSELKYFEAGILGTPTIVSPTEAFRYAIVHGENGLHAESKNDWINCLNLLISDEKARIRIGENALADVLVRYNPNYRSKEFGEIIDEIQCKHIGSGTHC